MTLKQFEKKKICLLGFGKEGMANLAFLRHHFPEKKLTILDKRLIEELPEDQKNILQNDKNIQYFSGPKYLDTLQKYDIILRTPGIRMTLPPLARAIKNGAFITSGTNLFFEHTKGKIIGVTGTKGKSTTSSLIYEILKAAGKNVKFIGNIGRPALFALLQEEPADYYVYELSSYQLEDLHQAPDVSVITNFYTDHLDYHGSLDNYFHAKMGILTGITPNKTIVFSQETTRVVRFLESIVCKKIACHDGVKNKISQGWLYHNGEKIMPANHIRLLGIHNIKNVLMAIAVAKIYDISNEVIDQAVSSFGGLPHRLQYLGVWNNITFIDDANATTPETTMEALDALQGNVHTLILGGLDRGYNFTALAKKILDYKIPFLILFPDSGMTIWKTMRELQANQGKKYKTLPEYKEASDMQSCIELVYKNTPPNTLCLLSNASPSYSIFKNFEEKGRLYQEWIIKLSEKNLKKEK